MLKKLSPDRFAKIDVLTIGQGTAGRTDRAAYQCSREGASSGERRARSTYACADAAAAERAVAGGLAASGK